MLAFWQFFPPFLPSHSFHLSIYFSMEVAQWSYVGGGCSVCMWRAQQENRTGREATSLPSSLYNMFSICSQVLENLWPYMPLTHSQTAYWYHLCVWWNGRHTLHSAATIHRAVLTRLNLKHWLFLSCLTSKHHKHGCKDYELNERKNSTILLSHLREQD